MYPAAHALPGIDALVRPRSIVVIGASAKRTAGGNELLRNLAASGYTGQVHVVHPAASRIEGHPVLASVADLPAGVDVAFVSVPAAAVVPTLLDLDDAGCRSAVVPAAGMTAEQLADLDRVTRERSIVVHGPNCMGVINAHAGVTLWPYEDMLTIQRPGNVSLVSQSGSATIFITRSLETASLSKVVSTGSEVGLSAENYLTWLATDPETDAVGLVLESIKDVPGFVAAVRSLREAGKPLVVLKVGRTAAGAAATTAHTGALVGRDEVYAALFARLDVPVVGDYDELAAALELLSWRAGEHGRDATGSRVAAVTISGGQAALTADLASARAVPLASFTPATATTVGALLPGVHHVQNPLDTGDEDYAETAYGDTLVALAADPGVDSVLVVLDAQATLTDAEVEYEMFAYAEVVRAAAAVAKPVVVTSSSSVSTHPRCRAALGGVPLLRGIPNALVALRALGGNRRPVPGLPPRPADLPGPAAVAALRAAVAEHEGALEASLARRVVTAYGLPFVAATTVTDLTAARAWAQGRYPVVVKIDSPDVPHRSDVGAVVLDVADDDQLADALATVAANVRRADPTARIVGFELQEQVVGGLEVLLGFVADPVFGATVTVGMGGVLVELLDDAASAAAPLTTGEAAELVARTRLNALLDGYRGVHPPTDRTELVGTLARLSWLAADLGDLLTGADLNPAVVEPGSGRVRLVDVLLERPAGHPVAELVAVPVP